MVSVFPRSDWFLKLQVISDHPTKSRGISPKYCKIEENNCSTVQYIETKAQFSVLQKSWKRSLFCHHNDDEIWVVLQCVE